ncbi:MAG: DEAD/DEAH box helicase family protein [Clostridia bacterium]|nr:DEAD/DEAH box helicase family protein [Clostridia bacterium]
MESYKNLSEEDTRNIYITPALTKKWNLETQIRSEVYFTAGKVIVRGNVSTRAKGEKADYILYYNSSKPIAVVEAKKYDLEVGTGMQQAIEYAKTLDLPFAYSTNGIAFLEHDMLTGNEREISMDDFPSPDDLWYRYKVAKSITEEEEKIINEPYYYAPGVNKPRYYQTIAINRTCEAIAKGQKRLLLVMATGTGKTYTAFQIIHRLKKSGLKRKILYLADRNMLIDQTMTQDFQPFTKVMTKVENRKMDSSFEIYMALYQQLTNGQGTDIFKQFSEDFFDLIIVDECHRGSAADDSNWKKILEYYKSATQIGLTATPKETNEISNIQYFGEPIYTYSLKQGIDDGFLAPYKVIRINLDKDLVGYRPEAGKRDVNGNIIEDDEIYYQSDMDKKIIIDERTQAVAKRVTEFLKNTNRYNKTIVFCIDIEHAERMRQALIKENNDMVAENPNYIMRITGDNQIGKAQLENFIDVEEKYPTIVTTSKLLTTGADCKTCKLIVLDSNINSMTEFKQIIGRGTRIREDYNKTYFTIMDFRNASRLFSDPDFDGEPVSIKNINPGDDTPNDSDENAEINKVEEKNKEYTTYETPTLKPIEIWGRKGKLHVNGVEVNIYNEIVSYYDKNGKLVTESLKDFSKKSILNEYASLDDFLHKWNSTDRKQVILDELKQQGVLIDELRKDIGIDDIGDFDLILHIAYDKKPLTRYERVNNVIKKGYLYKYSEMAQNILKDLLEKYSDNNELELTDTKILELMPFNEYGSPMDIVDVFGGKDKYIEVVEELENELYAS